MRIFTYPDVPDYEGENVVLLYPGKEAKSLSEACKGQEGNGGSRPIDRVVFIDSTWNQAKRIYLDPRVAKLPQVVIQDRETVFWRYQKGLSKTHLATIEVRND